MADLKEFITHVRDTGLAVGSHFAVIFNGDGDTEKMALLVDQATLPGITIMTTEMRTFGEITDSAYGITYPPVTLSIILDNEGSAKKFFDDWSDKVFNKITRTSGYYSSYTSDVEIQLLDKNHDVITSVLLIEAYPKQISDVQLDSSNHDIIRLNVTLTYKHWIEFETNQGIPIEDRLRGETQYANREENFGRLFSNAGNPDNDFVSSLRDWGTPAQLPKELSQFGGDMGSSLSRSLGSCTRALSDSNGNPISLIAPNGSNQSSGFKEGLNNLTSNFVTLGSGLKELSSSLNSITAPVSAIAGAVSSVSGTLGSIDSTLNVLGLGTPFNKIRQNLNKTSSDLGTVAGLKGLPSHIGTIGANMGAMGTTFKQVSKSLDTVSTAPAQFKSALNKLGFNLDRQGSNLSNGASNLDSYADANGFF
jgi:T4-like virus tail tube protein gp19